jgi:hypothetical protein
MGQVQVENTANPDHYGAFFARLAHWRALTFGPSM